MSKSHTLSKGFIPKILISFLLLLVLIPAAAMADSEDRSIHRICEIVPDSTKNAPHSVTVISGNCTEAGTLATLAILQGEKAEEFLNQQDVKFTILRD